MNATIPSVILTLTFAIACPKALARVRGSDNDVTYGGCDTAYELARAARTRKLNATDRVELTDGRCSLAKLEYLRAAWPTGQPGLPGYAARGVTRLHAASALADRKALGGALDPEWLAGFFWRYGAKGIDALRFFHAGRLPAQAAGVALLLGYSDAVGRCDVVCSMLRWFDDEPEDLATTVRQYLELANPGAIARLIDLGPSAHDEILRAVAAGSEFGAERLTGYLALRRAGDGRHEQVLVGAQLSRSGWEIAQGERREVFRLNRVDLRRTLAVLILRAWGW